MTRPVIADCGLWRRTLLIDADGSRDTGTDVVWLQASTGYVDSRGFAGTLYRRDDVFEWHRDFDLRPPGSFPDVGAMRWEGHVLIETGVHEDYVEHWVRDEGPTEPVGALFLSAPDGGVGLLVRVGDVFGWAGGGEVFIDKVRTPRWSAIVIDGAGHQIWADGVRWLIERSEGKVNP